MGEQHRNKDRVRLYIRVSKTIKKEALDLCKKRGISLTDLVESLLSKSLNRN